MMVCRIRNHDIFSAGGSQFSARGRAMIEIASNSGAAPGPEKSNDRRPRSPGHTQSGVALPDIVKQRGPHQIAPSVGGIVHMTSGAETVALIGDRLGPEHRTFRILEPLGHVRLLPRTQRTREEHVEESGDQMCEGPDQAHQMISRRANLITVASGSFPKYWRMNPIPKRMAMPQRSIR